MTPIYRSIFLLPKVFFTALFCLFMSKHSFAQTTPTILVMGDSISAEYGLPRNAGWVHLMEQELIKDGSSWKVFNASISGETTAGGISRLPALLQQKHPGLVMIELGANDALRGLPLSETEKNLRSMISMSKKSGAKVLLIGMQIPPNYGRDYTEQFKKIYPRIAKEESVVLTPFLLAGVADKPELFQEDHIHPNAAAQSILFKNVWGSMAPYQSLLREKSR